jgi:DNA-binding response OmpR family regulator
MNFSLSVLLVEDEPLIAMLAEEMLADLGHRATTVVASLEDGLRAIEAHSFDLALLDVNLNGSFSFPIADAAAGKGIPVLFLTGFGREHMGSLADAFVLHKPYSSSDLDRAIRDVLEARFGHQ